MSQKTPREILETLLTEHQRGAICRDERMKDEAKDRAEADIEELIRAARLEELERARKTVQRQRPVFLTEDNTDPFGEDLLAEKSIRVRNQLRKEIVKDFDDRIEELRKKEE